MTALLASLLISVVAQFAPTVLTGLHAAYRSIWPQGWTFFTGLSTRVSAVGYTLTGDGRQLTPITQRRSLADRSWGLSRTGEAGRRRERYATIVRFRSVTTHFAGGRPPCPTR